MTIIYGYCGDEDTKALKAIWKGIENVKVVDAFKTSHEDVRDAIVAEKDILVLCGHGSSEGLFGANGYAVDGLDAGLIQAQYVIGVWCHAKAYAKKYHVEGFFTSMYISNINEARICLSDTSDLTNEIVLKSVVRFCNLLNELIRKDIENIKDWPETILKLLPPINSAEKYNHEALEYVKF